MGFQIQIWFAVMKQDIICEHKMSTVEESVFITHFGRHNWIGTFIVSYYYENLAIYYSLYHNNFFNMLSQQQHINMQIRYGV